MITETVSTNELRIGNIVNKSGTAIKVTLSDLFDIEKNNSSYSPILLTSELLEKCEFIQRKKGCCSSNEWYHPSTVFFELINTTALGPEGFKIKAIRRPSDYLISIQLKHLHQLQNFYYATTGSELKTSYECI